MEALEPAGVKPPQTQAEEAALWQRHPHPCRYGSPWQNGFVESFNGKLRDECLNREWFLSRQEAKLVIEKWRHFYNNERPHSALGNRTPALVGNLRRQKMAA
ncbi:transposase InsO family protein [Massilia violacea]|uniref:Transposase InsO family protein n=1 Tax=Pseudoduganella violacea TaxID=1715466 RepID=A0A7W5FW93_9BURK|nr:integrase core domain-containing protein [Pseudoduganella violacea]MBB3121790.1 transposase InsO family protein [Pseudoduganella violacea]